MVSGLVRSKPLTKRIKIILIGDSGVGKSTFFKRYQKTIVKNYVSTFFYQNTLVTFYTTHGPIHCDLWDPAGRENMFGYFADKYCQRSTAAIIMFDVTSRITYKSVPGWHKAVERVCGPIPVVVCGNKCDRERSVKKWHINYPRKKNLKYFDISNKSHYNCEEPLLYIFRKLARDDTLQFAPQTAYMPPLLSYILTEAAQVQTAETAEAAETEMIAMLNTKIIDDDDDL